MKSFKVAAIILILNLCGNGLVSVANELRLYTIKFELWQEMYNKTFSKGPAYDGAFQRFIVNYKRMIRQDLRYFKGDSKFLMRMNSRFCDELNTLTGAKFIDSPPSVAARAFNYPTYPKPPASLDYRNLGLVTSVMDQGLSCSSCYAFAAICGLEGQIAKKYGRLVQLSAQNIVDCSSSTGNYGCDGGSITLSYRYIMNNKGIANNSAYPYVGDQNSCSYAKSMFSASALSYSFVSGDENYLKSALAAIGPLPVGMMGSLDTFYYYSSGIYDDPSCSTAIDHTVCLVGYGTDNTTSPPTNYWIAKNSWSTEWGESGYFRLKMGSNLCGIRNYVLYPNV